MSWLALEMTIGMSHVTQDVTPLFYRQSGYHYLASLGTFGERAPCKARRRSRCARERESD